MLRNKIRDWLLRAQSEFKTPEEMREAAGKVTDKNTAKLLQEQASKWAAKLQLKNSKHWSHGNGVYR
jgi:hypothetical protein